MSSDFDFDLIYNNLQMKTVQSFFPTRTKSNGSNFHSELKFHLIRKKENKEPSALTEEAEEETTEHENIFRNHKHEIKKYSLDQKIDRPIGGVEMYKRMDKAAKESNQRKVSKRSNKDNTQRNIQTAAVVSRFRRERLDSEMSIQPPVKENNQDQPISQQPAYLEEVFREDYDYAHRKLSSDGKSVKGRSQGATFSKQNYQSESLFRPSTGVTKKEVKHNEWVSSQQKGFQDKMALLSEINYKKPLVQLYGDRYFEYILRNRFEDDLKPPAFIYQIKDKFSDDKTICRLRKYKPNLIERKQMIIKGRKSHFQPNS